VRPSRIEKVLRRLDLTQQRGALDDVLPKPVDAGADVADIVREILSDVRLNGDDAVEKYGQRFDKVEGDPTVAVEAIEAAYLGLDGELRASLELAWDRILRFHQSELSTPAPFDDGGVVVEHRTVPVSRAGIYAPGGLARYPSSVLMAAGAARAAGVPSLVLCCPPSPSGAIDEATLAAAYLAGITEVHAIGGAQAIGAMAYGTKRLKKVDVIAGPGNAFVAEAKRQVLGVVGVAAGFAGPSEVAVVVDDSVDPRFAAIDLMVQAEHGPDGIAWLIATSAEVLDAVDRALADLVAEAPRR